MQVLSHPRLSRTLQVLQSNPAAKIFLVNVATVAAPRVYIDYHRNKDAGNETFFYEGFSLFSNFVAPGLLALGTASLLKKYNNPLRINTTQWISNEAVDSLSHHYKAVLGKLEATSSPAERQKAFLKQVLSHLEAKRALDGKLTQLQPSHVEHIAQGISTLSSQAKAPKALVDRMTSGLESADQIELRPAHAQAKSLAIQPKDFLNQLSRMSHEFQKAHSPEQVQQIVGKLHFSNHAKAAVSLSIVATLGFFAQFINKWITKERTGQTGFVGTENLINNQDEESASPEEGLSANGKVTKQQDDKTMGERLVHQVHVPSHSNKDSDNQNLSARTLKREAVNQAKTLNQISKTAANYPVNQPISPKDKKNQQQPAFGGFASNQFLPNVDQLKYLIYPAGIIGKMLASRSIDELRETSIKAGFAYFNLLFIPNLVENIVAYAAGKHHIFSRKPDLKPLTPESSLWEKTKYYFKAVNHAHVRSYEDINLYAKQYAQKLSTLNDTALEKELHTLIKKPQALMESLRGIENPELREKQLNDVILKRMRWVKNTAVLSGIVYSALTLGIGLNLLNIYITNRKYRSGNTDGSEPLFGKHNPFSGHTQHS